MIVGSADVNALAADAPEVGEFASDDVELGGVTCFQLTAEMRNSAREPVLPPSLHPTIPAALSIQAYRVESSPWGAFHYVTVRVSCRSGVRARGFTTATVVDTQAACEGLRTRFGYPSREGEIYFRSGYDGVSLSVDDGGERILAVNGIDPEPMGLTDIQYTGTLNLAHTPKGLRLMQVEANEASTQVDRLTSTLTAFDGAAWGNALLAPYMVIASSVAKMSMVIPAVRFVCKADELAFTGTEAV